MKLKNDNLTKNLTVLAPLGSTNIQRKPTG